MFESFSDLEITAANEAEVRKAIDLMAERYMPWADKCHQVCAENENAYLQDTDLKGTPFCRSEWAREGYDHCPMSPKYVTVHINHPIHGLQTLKKPYCTRLD